MSAPTTNIIPSTNPAEFGAAVTPSDSTVIKATRGLWVGGAGNVNAVLVGDGAAVLFSGVPAGTLLPIRAIQVLSTNTTATLITALY